MKPNDLVNRSCAPCKGGAKPLTAAQARLLKKQLSGKWNLAEKSRALRRTFAFRDFFRTMSYVNALAHLANLEDHHPDLEIGYNYCRIRLSTHAVGGLSDNDFILAAKIDRLAAS
jgi:4a-hydroxytetrahydrobiopterin dehydratase